ncbi:MAG: hypothetical protein M1814_005575 [Vezdaea aestivalis]|nr:MAG: hypothetical protein M1814_005575 [Vezdaea aestivalis]
MAIIPLIARDYISCDGYGNCYRYRTGWTDWGRWVFLGLAILGIIFLGFLFACVTNRRRRRRNMQPYQGTGWIGGGAHNNHATTPATNQYSNNQYQNPPPSYGPGNQGYYSGQTEMHSGANAGYYGGGQENGVAPSMPTAAHANPGKDGIVR